MKLYARLENKFSENDHVIDEVIRYYTEQEVLNEYWSYWVDHTDSFLTKENCLTDWLNTYKGWINDELQAYKDAQDEILATQYKILDEILTKKKLEYNKIMKQEQYIWIDIDGDKLYYKDKAMTTCHRLDGPAIEYASGTKAWYVDGKRHRLDGPAIEWSGGDKSWYVDDKQLSEKQFLALTSPTLELTLEQIAAKFGVDASKVKIKK